MQAAVNAIKSHMIRCGVKHIPLGPFPHYHHQVYQDSNKGSANHDVKSFIYNAHSRPRSASPLLDYDRAPQPRPVRSPIVNSRSPRRTENEEHYRQSDTIVLTHSNHEQRLEQRGRTTLSKVSPYYRADELRREEGSPLHNRKRRHSDRDLVDEERRHFIKSEPGFMKSDRSERIERRNSTTDFHPFRYKNTSPTPDNRLSLYEENARKYAEERLKVLDRYAYARENGFYRRSEQPIRNGERLEQNGHLLARPELRTQSVSPRPNGDAYEAQRRSPMPTSHRSPPLPAHNTENNHSRHNSPNERTHLSPRNVKKPSAIVLRSDYLPTSSSEKIYHHSTPVPRSPGAYHCYMYRRYSPMVDVSTQTATESEHNQEGSSSVHYKGLDVPVRIYSDHHEKTWTRESPISRYEDQENGGYTHTNGVDHRSKSDSPSSVRQSPDQPSPAHYKGNDISTRVYNDHQEKSWKMDSPVNRYEDQENCGYAHTNGNDRLNRSDSPNSVRNSPTNGTHCKCGCMDTIESPTASGTVVVYPKEVV